MTFLLHPHSTLITGVEDDPGGGLRVFVGARYRHIYFVPFPQDERAVLSAWGGGWRGHCLADARDCVLGPSHMTLPGHDSGFHDRAARR